MDVEEVFRDINTMHSNITTDLGKVNKELEHQIGEIEEILLDLERHKEEQKYREAVADEYALIEEKYLDVAHRAFELIKDIPPALFAIHKKILNGQFSSYEEYENARSFAQTMPVCRIIESQTIEHIVKLTTIELARFYSELFKESRQIFNSTHRLAVTQKMLEKYKEEAKEIEADIKKYEDIVKEKECEISDLADERMFKWARELRRNSKRTKQSEDITLIQDYVKILETNKILFPIDNITRIKFKFGFIFYSIEEWSIIREYLAVYELNRFLPRLHSRAAEIIEICNLTESDFTIENAKKHLSLVEHLAKEEVITQLSGEINKYRDWRSGCFSRLRKVERDISLHEEEHSKLERERDFFSKKSEQLTADYALMRLCVASKTFAYESIRKKSGNYFS